MKDNVSKALGCCVSLCKAFEGFRSTPYLCPAGYWTIGYGTVYKPDGSRVTEQHPVITQELADMWLMSTLKNVYMTGILKASPGVIRFPLVLGALTDFAYNLGVSRYRASTLRKRVEVGDWEESIVEIKKWRKAGGRVLNGLVRRRAAEAELISHAC